MNPKILLVLFSLAALVSLGAPACSDGHGPDGGDADVDVADGTDADTGDTGPDTAPDADAQDPPPDTESDGPDASDAPYDPYLPDTDAVPNPTLEDLADNTALDLGPTNLVGAEDESYNADAVTDYSGFVYDANHHLMLMFGGGHATTYTDSVYAFNFDTLAWEALYPPTPASMMVCSNFSNDLGGWLSGPEGPYPRPAARHTYDMLEAPTGHPQFLVLRTGGGGNEQVDTCEYYWGGVSYALYNLEGGTWDFLDNPTWSGGYGDEAAEFDPDSGLVVMFGRPGLFLYDPETRTTSTALTDDDMGYPDLGYANELVYYPPNRNMYYFNRNASTVWELVLDRADFSRSTFSELATTGTYPPHGEPGYDYDEANQVIGGAVHENAFYVFDPAGGAWSSEAIQGGSPGSMSFHALAYDPVDNVFIFITDERRTWAYRYRN
jgi:hypothetical protein